MGGKKFWSRGRLDYLEKCPACSRDINCSPVCERKDDRLLMPDKWLVVRCCYCSSVFINPRPRMESLPGLYVDYLTHDIPEGESVESSNSFMWSLIRGYLGERFNLAWGRRSLKYGFMLFSLIPPIRNKLDRYGRNLTKVNSKEGKKLLDIGCGSGGFLAISERMGWEAVGCDFDEVVVGVCKSQGLNVRLGGLDAFCQEVDRFDVITLNQVIEHVVAPEQLIKDCCGFLNEEGVIWIALPNPNSIGCKVFGACWGGLHSPYHLCLPSQSVLVLWLQRAGFYDIKIINRGPHAKANWLSSQVISKKHRGVIKNRLALKLYFYLAETLSLFSSRWAEETVISAKKQRSTERKEGE